VSTARSSSSRRSTWARLLRGHLLGALNKGRNPRGGPRREMLTEHFARRMRVRVTEKWRLPNRTSCHTQFSNDNQARSRVAREDLPDSSPAASSGMKRLVCSAVPMSSYGHAPRIGPLAIVRSGYAEFGFREGVSPPQRPTSMQIWRLRCSRQAWRHSYDVSTETGSRNAAASVTVYCTFGTTRRIDPRLRPGKTSRRDAPFGDRVHRGENVDLGILRSAPQAATLPGMGAVTSPGSRRGHDPETSPCLHNAGRPGLRARDRLGRTMVKFAEVRSVRSSFRDSPKQHFAQQRTRRCVVFFSPPSVLDAIGVPILKLGCNARMRSFGHVSGDLRGFSRTPNTNRAGNCSACSTRSVAAFCA